MSTLKDVAKYAGVSTSTVSRVINGRDYVSEVARQKVHEAINALGYQPNLLAQSLVKGTTTRQLGVLVYDIANSYFAEITKAFEAIAYEHDYAVILCNTAEGSRTSRYLDMFIQRNVDGVAIIGSKMETEIIKRLQILLERNIYVALTREKEWIDNPLMDALGGGSGVVEFDTRKGAYMAIDFLISQGHERIAGLFSTRKGELKQDPRFRGYMDAMIDRGIPFDEKLLVADLSTNKDGGFLGMSEILRRKTGCTAVFAFNDLLAIGALALCQREGIRVPDELSVISMDDTKDSIFTNPPLTTIRIPRKEQGEFMANYLVTKIQGGDPPPFLSLPVQLTVRQSVRSLREKKGESAEKREINEV